MQELSVQDFAPDLSTRGCFPKAWIREEEGFLLLKDGGEETAIDAVRHIGLRQISEVDMSRFVGMEQEAEMFVKRLTELRKYAGSCE